MHVFAGGSLGEFYEPSGEGKQLFSLPGKLALLACRPSRELVDFVVLSNAREGEINLSTGDQREVSDFQQFLQRGSGENWSNSRALSIE